MRNWYLGNYKKVSKNILTKDAKNEILGPSGVPLHIYKC